MKMIAVPKLLHELFGKKTTGFELWHVLFFAFGMSAVLLGFTFEEWSHLQLWRVVLLALLLVDICGGVIANLTWSTNDYYRNQPTARLIFIVVHIQPILFAALLADYFPICLAVWSYTVLASLIVHSLAGHPAQRAIGASLALLGAAGLVLSSGKALPALLLLTLLFYMLKVIYSFGVDHYASRTNEE
ncbi:hypothetical protein [Paenibacillus senegalensis]|uniref:hypothetical protein n=1 Tax=Paenibacillus senegalensis TaxID=1465766 RepID=UPI000288A828|nr:hypothetical protein [Paenibacillus senegalensis]